MSKLVISAKALKVDLSELKGIIVNIKIII